MTCPHDLRDQSVSGHLPILPSLQRGWRRRTVPASCRSLSTDIADYASTSAASQKIREHQVALIILVTTASENDDSDIMTFDMV
jgi:hypothetical protein